MAEESVVTMENGLANGKCDDEREQEEQQYEMEPAGLAFSYDEMDNKTFDFDAHSNGNDMGSGDEYDSESGRFDNG
jgi:hypothetical protein